MAQVVLKDLYKLYPPRASSGGKTALGGNRGTEPRAAVPVLEQINLTIADGEFLVLVGPSGCGKSTLLRTIAGLEMPTGGQVWVGDRPVTDLPPKDRDIAMVFQSYALYPHLTVYDNLAFGLRRLGQAPPPLWAEGLRGITRRLPWRYEPAQERAIAARVREVAALLQIEPLLDRLPKQLSGGQKQRVALGRAIARQPQVFLMDEPLSNLDAKLRAETRAQIVQLQRQLGITTIYVTHDQTEAMTMGDRIALLHQGRIQQLGAPLELYRQPANRFVAEFIGSPPMGFLPVWVQDDTLRNGQFRLPLPQSWHAPLAQYQGQPLWLGVRPEQWQLTAAPEGALAAQITAVEALGAETYCSLAVSDPDFRGAGALGWESPELPGLPQRLQVRLGGERAIAVGETVGLAVSPRQIHLFDPRSGRAIHNSSTSEST